jgi:hypothetical protein
MLEQAAQRQVDLEKTDPRNDLRRQQRMAAQVEEIRANPEARLPRTSCQMSCKLLKGDRGHPVDATV